MIGAVNETGSPMIIFLYLPPTGATYIKSSDVGVNANTEEFLRCRRERRIWAESRRRGKSNAHLYCSYIAENFLEFSHFMGNLLIDLSLHILQFICVNVICVTLFAHGVCVCAYIRI